MVSLRVCVLIYSIYIWEKMSEKGSIWRIFWLILSQFYYFRILSTRPLFGKVKSNLFLWYTFGYLGEVERTNRTWALFLHLTLCLEWFIMTSHNTLITLSFIFFYLYNKKHGLNEFLRSLAFVTFINANFCFCFLTYWLKNKINLALCFNFWFTVQFESSLDFESIS